MNPIEYIDNYLNRISMYKLVLYGLAGLIVAAVAACFTGFMSLSGWSILVSVLILIAVCETSNLVLAKLYRVPSNSESAVITALILCLIMPPVTTTERAIGVALTGLLAIAGKYIVTWHHKHIFNPAAFGAVIASISGLAYATWWVGNPTLFPFVLLLGFLIFQKLDRGPMGGAFFVASLAMASLVAVTNSQNLSSILQSVILSGPLLFLGAVMLTEPSTTPPTSYYQILYAGLVGILFASTISFGTIAVTPQLALVIGNILAFTVSFKGRVKLTLVEKNILGPSSYDYAFKPNRAISFVAGQYMQWTLGHKAVDSRGNRRTFTIASAPSEDTVHLGVKFAEHGSSYKAALTALKQGDSMLGDTIAGDFRLPRDKQQKMLWIAGGIGITPFRSMAQQLLHTGGKRDIILLHFARTADDFSYHETFKQAATIGLKYVPIVTGQAGQWDAQQGRISKKLLQLNVPDITERSCYVSGSLGIITSAKQNLRALHVSKSKIKHDTFSGY